MKRRRTADFSATTTIELSRTRATSPETRLRRSKRSTSNPPAKTSRLQPTTPLHMTTRAASRAATNSTTNSVTSADSRRSSLADAAALGNGSDGEEHLAKRTRRSLKSETSPNGLAIEKSDVNGVRTPSNGSQESSQSSRKRKRQPEILESIEGTLKTRETNQEDGTVAQEEVDEERLTRPIRDTRTNKRVKRLAVQAPVASPSDLSALNSPAYPPEHGDDGEPTSNGQAPEKPVKRLPGRRRAPHANQDIEADLRRQLTLKMGYRAIVKQLKPVLNELAQRSMDQINEDPLAHQETEYFEQVQDQLDAIYALRRSEEQAWYQLEKERIKRDLSNNSEIRKQICAHDVIDEQEDCMSRAQYKFLQILRRSTRELDAEATEDEGDDDRPIPAFRAPATKSSPGYIIDERYDSRSRRLIETENAWDDAAKRQVAANFVRRELPEKDQDVDVLAITSLDTFATYDEAQHEAVNGVRKRKALLAAVERAQEESTAEERAAEVESRKTDDALNILAAVSEAQLPVKPITPPAGLTTPHTPVATRSTRHKRPSAEDEGVATDEAPSAPPSSRPRRSSRASRTRESSPAKQATPQRTRSERAETPRTSSNKIKDLLNEDAAAQLPAIVESSSEVPSGLAGNLAARSPQEARNQNAPSAPAALPSTVIDLDPLERSQEQHPVAHHTIEYPPRTTTEARPGSRTGFAPRIASAGTFWSMTPIKSENRNSQERDSQSREGTAPSSSIAGRRASDGADSAGRPHHESAGQRHTPRIPAPIEISDTSSSASRTPSRYGDTNVTSPTLPRQSFHHRTTSLGSRPSPFAREDAERREEELARKASTAVPHQYGSQREPPRTSHDRSDLRTPVAVISAPAPSSRPGHDSYYHQPGQRDRRSSGPPTPTQQQFSPYQSPFPQAQQQQHPPYGYAQNQGPAWQSQPPPQYTGPQGPHPPYSGPQHYSPQPASYHTVPPPPPHYQQFAGQPTQPGSSPTSASPFPAYYHPQQQQQQQNQQQGPPYSGPPRRGSFGGPSGSYQERDTGRRGSQGSMRRENQFRQWRAS